MDAAFGMLSHIAANSVVIDQVESFGKSAVEYCVEDNKVGFVELVAPRLSTHLGPPTNIIQNTFKNSTEKKEGHNNCLKDLVVRREV